MQYDREWKQKQREWKVVYAHTSSGLTKGQILTIEPLVPPNPPDVMRVNRTTVFATDPVPVPDADQLKMKVGANTVEIRRRVCLIGPDVSGGSGGASWVAEEGTKP